MTHQELEYLKQLQQNQTILKVLVNPDRAPYSYFEDGQAKGILPDIFARIAELMNLRYEYVPVKTTSEMQEVLSRRQADIVLDAFADYNEAERAHLMLTDPYITTEMARLTRRDFSGEIKTVALPQILKNNYLTDYFPNDRENLLIFESRDACVQAVRSGQADAAYMDLHVAQKYIHDDYRNQFQINIMPKARIRLAIGVADHNDYRLLTILNKGVNSVKGPYVDQMVLKDTDYGKAPVTIFSLIYGNPLLALAFVVLLAAVTGALILSLRRAKWENSQRLREATQRQILSDALETARHASEAKSRFLSRVSHEIRTPLNAIIGYMAMARKGGTSPERVDHYMENTGIAATHLLHIINDVLDISSIESGRMKIAREDFDLLDIVNEIRVIFANQAAEKGLRLSITTGQLAYERINGDPLRIRQVLVNLLSNALKFTPDGGSVCLKVEQSCRDERGCFVKFVV